MPILTLLVGVPASGKSTYRQLNTHENEIVVSSDDIIEEYCQQEGITYSEGFSKFAKAANKEMRKRADRAFENKQDIIWDQTNLTTKSRKSKIEQAKEQGYLVRAVVFETPERNELDRRLNSRSGKHIPKHVIDNMINNYETPSLDEGFKYIQFER